MKQTVNLTCPVCNQEVEWSITTRLNTRENPNLKKDLLAGKLFDFECPVCGAKRQLETTFLYHDPDKKLMIFLIPNYQSRQEEIEALLDQMASQEGVDIHDYQLRLVLHSTDLIEKVTLFDWGLSDQEIEIVKVLTDGLFAQEFPGKLVHNRFFYIKDKTPKILYITEDDQLLVDFHDSLLEFANSKFNKAIVDQHQGQFMVINQAWALNALDKKNTLKDETIEAE
ncbi:CpXC domain-containing protein [Vaginisenegalia massiliensis]|uniref:CpXC domain-containing protein n=1 Tax=Vaginisenegalia massiliensis TaxID=2058294 RepID=UPI000F54C004|nr:CpXC domain-containing protein [Vaginisenegalia massiliensis]